jgi:hypothetical protein
VVVHDGKLVVIEQRDGPGDLLGHKPLFRHFREHKPGPGIPGQLTPELNPNEYIWGHLKHHELANRCAADYADLKTGARNRLRSMQRRPIVMRAFWRQAELPL